MGPSQEEILYNHLLLIVNLHYLLISRFINLAIVLSQVMTYMVIL